MTNPTAAGIPSNRITGTSLTFTLDGRPYRLTFELHFLDHDGDAGASVRTHRCWDLAYEGVAVAVHEVFTDGALDYRKVVTEPAELELLANGLADLAGMAAGLTDAEARTHITATTGAAPAARCGSVSCGAPVPIGATRCTIGHSVARVGTGN